MTHFIDAILEPALGFLADWSLRWAVLIGVAALGLLIFRPRRSATRQLVCLVALAAGLVLPLAPRWGSGWYSAPKETAATPQANRNSFPSSAWERRSGSSASRPAEGKTRSGASPAAFPSGAWEPEDREEREGKRGENETAKAPPPDEVLGNRRLVVLALALCWSAGVLGMLLRWGCGAWFLKRLRRGAVEMRGLATETFAACRAELGVRIAVRLAAHPLVRSPALLGLFRPMILVPTGWPELPADVQRGGLLHELAHVRRRDHWLAPLLQLVRAGFFFHPLVRWLLARMEYERELLCDEMAVSRGIDRRDYARMLLEFARHSGRFALPRVGNASYLPIGRRRTIKARIRHLLEENMERRMGPLPARWAVVLGAGLLILALGAASYRVLAVGPEKAPAPQEPDQPPVAKKKDKNDEETPKRPRDARTRREALRYGGKNFDQWRTELVTELKPSIRVDGMKALAAFGANGYGHEATQSILEMMHGYDVMSNDSSDPDAHVVGAGYTAIHKIGAASVPALIGAVKGENRNARRFAIQALSDLGTDARPAMPALLQAMKSNDAETRRRAIGAVGPIDPHAKGIVPALIKALQDAETESRAMEAIQLVGEEAKSATPTLLALLRGKNAQEQMGVIRVLAAIGAKKESAVAASRLLRDKDQGFRQVVFQFLQSLGADAKEAVPALIAVVKDPDDPWRIQAVTTLREIGPAAKEAALVLSQLMEFSDPNLQAQIRSALKRINP